MPSLADRLKSLGVKIGTADLPARAPKAKKNVPIEDVLDGRWIETRQGEAFVAESIYPLEYRHGLAALSSSAPLHNLAHWAGDMRIHDMPIEKFAFLDTETSGLSGGTGTYAFLVGIGRFISTDSLTDSRIETDTTTDSVAPKELGQADSPRKKRGRRIKTDTTTDSLTDSRTGTDDGMVFKLQQFFMRDPAEEAALLEAIIDFLAPCEALVTFNGKAFDAPLLNTRYALHNIPVPYKGYAHIDLLPLARRLWRDRLPSRALKYLEEHVLLAPRTLEEVPSYEIPWIYFDYLRTGDAGPLKGVFYHNAMDIVAMTALFSQTAGMLADPHQTDLEHGLDVVALARLFEDLGKWDDAARLYERGLEIGLPEAGFMEALRRYSALQRRRGDVESAVALWLRAAGEGHIYAHVELSKHYEHRQRELDEALRWAASALQLAQAPSLPNYIRKHWLDEINHRLERLQRKADHGKHLENTRKP